MAAEQMEKDKTFQVNLIHRGVDIELVMIQLYPLGAVIADQVNIIHHPGGRLIIHTDIVQQGG